MRNLSEKEYCQLKKTVASTLQLLPGAYRKENGLYSKAEYDQVQHCFEHIMHVHHAVGACMILVFPNGRAEVFCSGKAMLHPKIPVDAQTCFRIASVTKLVSTFGILSLVETGQLDLDEDIGKYLQFPVRHPRYPEQVVTLRMLLTHTAGIRNADLTPVQTVSLEERFKDSSVWLDTAPGEQFSYTNLGAGLAGAVVERATGCLFEDIMQKRVFMPLGICAAYGAADMPVERTIADGYSVKWPFPPVKKYDAVFQKGQTLREETGKSVSKTVGRLITDPAGMAAFVRVLASRSNTDILSAGSLEEMRRCQDGTGGIIHAGRGLNVAYLQDVIPDRHLVGHQGVAYGMCSELFADPERNCGVGIMINGVELDHLALQRVGVQLLTLGFSVLS